MVQQYHNPFSNIGLIVPKVQLDFYDQYCQTQAVGRKNVDRSPFRRKVDLWFAGLSLAARKQFEPAKLKKQDTSQFNTGVVFDQDPWRIQALMLIAIAVNGNVKIVSDPRGMMDIANGLAAAGVDLIVEMLREGGQTPIWNLSDALAELLQEKQA